MSLLKNKWTDLDSFELRLLLDERMGRIGQYDEAPNVLYLPLAREQCRIALTFSGNKIIRIEPGPAFHRAEWRRISNEIENSILTGPTKIGREFSFSGKRVTGSWRGQRSQVQILPPPGNAPSAPNEIAEHPCILEFPIQGSELWRVTNHRRIREHRKLTRLLNVLLAARFTLLESPTGPRHFWALLVDYDRAGYRWWWTRQLANAVKHLRRLFRRNQDQGFGRITWAQNFFFAELGPPVIDQLSPEPIERIEVIDPDEYYLHVGYDGTPLRVPSDLDDSICRYQNLSTANRAKFDRAMFWMSMARQQWSDTVSASFASLVSAVESLTERGTTHSVHCDLCGETRTHDVPGATETFRKFFEEYAPGASLRNRRTAMYDLRSNILHGNLLMELDEGTALGWDPPGENQRSLHSELWALARLSMRNWLKSPPGA